MLVTWLLETWLLETVYVGDNSGQLEPKERTTLKGQIHYND